MTLEEQLSYPIDIYNEAMRKQVQDDSLKECNYCGRLHNIVCICKEAQENWQAVIGEVREVSEMNNQPKYTQNDAINDIIKELDETGRSYDAYEFGLPTHDGSSMEVMRYRIKEILSRVEF